MSPDDQPQFNIDLGPDGGPAVTLIVGDWRVDTTVAQRMLAHVVETIERIAETDLDEPVPHVIDDESSRVEPDVPAAVVVDPVDALRRVADATPDAVAVVDPGATVTIAK